MLTLRSSPPSPFGRKVKIAASLLGLMGEIKIENTDTTDPSDPIRKQNPLGKIPALVLEDGTVLYDSRVILEYLDLKAGGGKIIPASGMARIDALRLQALADGIMDAGILRMYEIRWRPEDRREEKWVTHQTGKMERALATLEAAPPLLSGMPNAGQITLACALGYLDFRFEGKWRAGYPNLVKWLDGFSAAVPAFETTKPH